MGRLAATTALAVALLPGCQASRPAEHVAAPPATVVQTSAPTSAPANTCPAAALPDPDAVALLLPDAPAEPQYRPMTFWKEGGNDPYAVRVDGDRARAPLVERTAGFGCDVSVPCPCMTASPYVPPAGSGATQVPLSSNDCYTPRDAGSRSRP